MDLLEKQRELQRASYVLLEERIKELVNDKTSHVQDFARAGGLLDYIRKFIEVVEDFILEYLQEVVSKVIQQDNTHYAKLLGVEYKNIHDAVAKPLAWILFDKNRLENAVEVIRKSKSDFTNMDEKVLVKAIKEVIEDLKKHLSIGADLYASLADEKNTFFKENSHRVTLAIWQLGSNEIVNMSMIHLLSLQQSDNADDENSANSRQVLGGEIGEAIHGRIAYRFLRDIEELKDEELKSIYRSYINNDFTKLEQCSKALLSNRIELEIGQKMLDLAFESTIIKEFTKPNDEKNFNYLTLNSELVEKMNKTDNRIANATSMVYRPMVIEPIDWKEMYGGGFLADEKIGGYFDLSCIKASTKKDREAINERVVPQAVLDAMNHLQKTPFKINTKMLKVLEDYSKKKEKSYPKYDKKDSGFAYHRILKELLSNDLYKKPTSNMEAYFKNIKYIKCKDSELSKRDKNRIKDALKAIKESSDFAAFKLDSEKIYYEISKYKKGFTPMLETIENMKKFEKIYFVWRMDFRGRLYPQQTLLHPQAGDILKSLLLFSKEQPLNNEGKRWFFIHGANCYGEVDKEIFDKRITWVEEKHEKILASAKDYKRESFWKEAGDPFKFLAWCFEYERYVTDPENFTTGIPVAIDGSNNGFQHITALLRDVEGAKMVNVLPTYSEDNVLMMNDFYAEVANELKKMMKDAVNEFLEQKESLEEEEGLFYKRGFVEVFEPAYHFNEISEELKKIEVSQLPSSESYFVNVLLKQDICSVKLNVKEKELLIKKLQKIERIIVEKKEKKNLKKRKFLIEKQLELEFSETEWDIEEGTLIIKKGKGYRNEEKLILVPSSLYQELLDKKLIGRSFVKGPVMTESYGSSTKGKAKALLEKIEENGMLSHLKKKSRKSVVDEITNLLEKSLSSVSSSPKKYKNWMKKYAGDILKINKPILWETPLGLEVEQVDFKAEKIKVSTAKGQRDVTFNIYTDELDTSAHKNGFSPNYIHSLDATHLIMTINGLKQMGINDVITVHDSFATHANDVDQMSLVLRKAFIALHKKEVLEDLTTFFNEQFGVEVKEVPYVNKEGFDLEQVMESEYFFG